MPDATPTQRLQDAEARLRGAGQVLAAAPTQVDTDRSWITRLVLRVFAAAIAAYVLFLLLQGIVPGASTTIASATESMIKTIIVPIVTLVLGYYFGQSSKG